jgi:hypothetical protein
VVSQSKLVLRAADRYPSNGPNRNGKVCQWILNYQKQPTSVHDDDDHNEDDMDAPYFSLITGKYASSSSGNAEPTPLELKSLPGKGHVTADVQE